MKSLELKVPPVMVVLLLLLGMFISRSYFPIFPIPSGLATGFAIAIICCANVFGIMAARDFSKFKTTLNPHAPQNTTYLVTKGVYAVTRNPMYVALIMVVAAGGIYLMHAGVIVFVVIAFFYLQEFQIKPEEKMLENKFGEAFTKYKNTVPRWF